MLKFSESLFNFISSAPLVNLLIIASVSIKKMFENYWLRIAKCTYRSLLRPPVLTWVIVIAHLVSRQQSMIDENGEKIDLDVDPNQFFFLSRLMNEIRMKITCFELIEFSERNLKESERPQPSKRSNFCFLRIF